MARSSRRKRRTTLSTPTILNRLRPLLSSKTTLLVIETILVLAVIVTGFWLRLIPWYTAMNLVNNPRLADIPVDLRQYGFLYGNDPWIEYWLANYLYENGALSWLGLTRDNPDTHLFWYPWGRDFTKSSYIFVPLLAASTYWPFSNIMSLQAWIALIPPLMSIFMIIIGYLYVRRLFGPLPALAILPLLAFTPASLDRTHGGFVEKEGITLPFIILGLFMFSEALSRKDKRIAIIAGITLGLPGFMWGGYMLLVLSIAAVAITLPLVVDDKNRLVEYFKLTILIGLVASLVLGIASTFNATKLIPSLAIGLGGPILAYTLYIGCTRVSQILTRTKKIKIPIMTSVKHLYGTILLIVVIASPFVLPSLGLAGRLVYTLYWPLRGLVKFHPLVESVAEHQPLYTAFLGDPRALPSLERINLILFTGLTGALVAILYHVYRKARIEVLPLALLSGGLLYGVLGMAYLLQSASVLGALTTAALIHPLITKSEDTRKTRQRSSEPSDLRRALAILILVAIVSAGLYNVALSYQDVSTRIPGILTSNSPIVTIHNPVNPSWLKLLETIRKELPKDAVVVTWWDYGYPISVAAKRPTLADGATINTTQIELLARILVSNETYSSKLLREFGLKPGKTFIMVHDVLAYNNNTAIYLAQIDIPKSVWMIRIAGYSEANYLEARNLPDGRQVYVFTPLRPGTYQGLIYQILADAAYNLANTNVTETDIRPANVTAVYLSPYSIPGVDVYSKPELKHFKPYKIIAYSSLAVQNTVYYVVIALYEWTG